MVGVDRERQKETERERELQYKEGKVCTSFSLDTTAKFFLKEPERFIDFQIKLLNMFLLHSGGHLLNLSPNI